MAGRAILVTGGSRGIGRAIVEAFAAAGDRVAIHYRDSTEAAAQLREALPGEGHTLVRGDLADPQTVRDVVDGAADALGGLDVLVNNAGIYTTHPVLDTSYEDWQRDWRATLDTNLVGAANATWCAAQHMRGRGGRIINVSSRGAFRGEARHAAYGASKAGLNSLTQSMAIALAPHGIAVMGVAPGPTATDMAQERLDSAVGVAMRAESPFNRVARPEEVASAVVWLASPLAEWASGAIVDLNGASYVR